MRVYFIKRGFPAAAGLVVVLMLSLLPGCGSENPPVPLAHVAPQVMEPGTPTDAEESGETGNTGESGTLPQAKPKSKPKAIADLGEPDPITGSYLTPYARKAKKKGRLLWPPQFDYWIGEALSPKMLSKQVPDDVLGVCPRFYELTTEQMKLFWAYLFQCIAIPESGLKPRTQFVEHGIAGVDRVTGAKIVSEGLLQLSYIDGPRHGCRFDFKADQESRKRGDLDLTIFDPRAQLECGVKILERQLFRHRLPIFTTKKPFYWSTLHVGSRGHGIIMEQMKGVPRFCRQAE